MAKIYSYYYLLSMKTMQLTREQRVFIVLNYQETKNYEIVRRNFEQIFPERISPTKVSMSDTSFMKCLEIGF